MAKQEKRIHKHVPKKSRLRDIADELWSAAVKEDWAGKCAICGHENTQSHHLVPRQHEATRYEVRNGIALCYRHHQACPDTSPHQNAAGFMDWLRERHLELHQWYVTHKWPQFDQTKDDWYYVRVIQSLREELDPLTFEDIAGIRFVQWLDEQE